MKNFAHIEDLGDAEVLFSICKTNDKWAFRIETILGGYHFFDLTYYPDFASVSEDFEDEFDFQKLAKYFIAQCRHNLGFTA